MAGGHGHTVQSCFSALAGLCGLRGCTECECETDVGSADLSDAEADDSVNATECLGLNEESVCMVAESPEGYGVLVDEDGKGSLSERRSQANAAAGKISCSVGSTGRISRNQFGRVMSMWKCGRNTKRQKILRGGQTWSPSDTIGLVWDFAGHAWGISNIYCGYPDLVRVLN